METKQKTGLLILVYFILVFYIFAQDIKSLIIDEYGNVGININEEINIDSALVVNGRINDRSGVLVPLGTILPYLGTNPPDGWIICDGRIINNFEDNGKFSELITLLKNESAGNPNHPYYHELTTNAKLPDLRGQFLRGADNSDIIVDPDRFERTNNDNIVIGPLIGSNQIDTFQGHQHKYFIPNSKHDAGLGGSDSISSSSNAQEVTSNIIVNDINTVSTETRPKNVYVNFIIKY